MSKKFTPNSNARWIARTDSASVVGPHTWPIPPPPHPTRDTLRPVRPRTVYSMISCSCVMGTPRLLRDCRCCDRVRIFGCSLAQEGEELPIDVVRGFGLQEVAVFTEILPTHLGEHRAPRLQRV